MGVSEKRWYALYTKSRHEEVVNKHLLYKSFLVLLPKRKVWSRRRDRRKIIEVPVFPGYVFVETFPKPELFNKILDTPGVVYILGKPRPEPIPKEDIESIRIMMKAKVDLEPYPYLKEGDRIRVCSGPLKGAVGWMVREDKKKNLLVVSLDLLHQSVSAFLPPCQIEKF